MQANGITVLRQNFRWGYSEPARGVFDWAQVDRFVLAAASHGIRVLPLLYGETPGRRRAPPATRTAARTRPRSRRTSRRG